LLTGISQWTAHAFVQVVNLCGRDALCTSRFRFPLAAGPRRQSDTDFGFAVRSRGSGPDGDSKQQAQPLPEPGFAVFMQPQHRTG